MTHPELCARTPSRSAIAAIALTALFLCLYLLGNGSHSLWDRDETRFAEATREMLASGDWIVPRLNGEIRYDKPILIYWLMGASMQLWGINEFAARFPSALAGALSVLLIFLLALRIGCDREGALVAALFGGLSPLLFGIAKAATTDATLLCAVMAALYLYWTQRRSAFSWARHLLFWIVLACSALAKGPPGIAVVFLTIAFFEICEGGIRRRFSLPSLARSAAGIVVFLAVLLPWTVAAWVRTDGDFLKVTIGHHVIARSLRPFEGHSGPFFYYLPVLLIGALPFTALLFASLRWGWKSRRDSEVRFLWCWAIPGLVIFSIVRTKLPHYVAPVMPALALMAGLWWTRRGAEEAARSWWRAGAIVSAVFGLSLAVALPLFAFRQSLPALHAPATFVALSLLVSSCLGLVCAWTGKRRTALGWWAGGLCCAYVLLLVWALPAIEPLRPSKPLALWLERNAPPQRPHHGLRLQRAEPPVLHAPAHSPH